MVTFALRDLTPEEKRLGRIKLIGGALCLDFCNTAENRHRGHYINILTTFRGLLIWGHHNNLLSEEEVEALLSITSESEQLEVLHQGLTLREIIYRIFDAQTDKLPLPVKDINFLDANWHQMMPYHHLVYTGEVLRWQWDDSGATKILWNVVQSAIDLLSQPNLKWVKQCPNCGWLFLDQSPKHNRTWCIMRVCGNRVKARRHYSRQKDQQSL